MTGLFGGSSSSGANDQSPTPELVKVKEAVLDIELPQQDIAASRSPSVTRHVSTNPITTAQQRSTRQQPVVKLLRNEQGHWIIAPDTQFINNLSWVVGFMELANAGDFAANVWNELPVPVYAVVFMAIGATSAGIMSIFAFRDAKRACYNIRCLRNQRQLLLLEKREREQRQEVTTDLDVILAVNLRELGTELVTRWIMDLLMGFGAILICIGTYMAIGGANHAVYLASNLLSGYVGNIPIALFGLANCSWALFIFCKSQAHVTKSQTLLGLCTAAALVKRRARKVQVFSVINGTATLLGGVASMITATRWWGYVIMIPVIISSIFCNMWWRMVMGYTRSEGYPLIECDDLVHALEFAAAAQFSSSADSEALPQWCPELPNSLADILRILTHHSLFDQYCLMAIAEPEIYQAVGGTSDTKELTITADDLCALPSTQTLINVAKAFVKNVQLEHFKNRERYLAELLGTYCTIINPTGSDKVNSIVQQETDNSEKI